MAEKLLGALGRGAYKATSDTTKAATSAATRATLDPVMFRSLYKAGIIGPLLESIVSEYKKSTSTSKQADSSTPNQTSNVITTNLTRSLQSMSNQLSAIADVMDDIRNLTRAQLKIDEKSGIQLQRFQRREQVAEIEGRLEAARPAASSIFEGIRGQTERQLGPIGKAASGAMGFVKDNPILSAIIGAGLFAGSDAIKEFVKNFREKSGIDKDIKEAVSGIGTSIGEMFIEAFKSLEIKIKNYINSLLPSFLQINPSSDQQTESGSDTARKIGQAALGFGVGRLIAGRLGGVTGALYGGTDASLGESAVTGAGLLAGGALASYGLKKGVGAAGEALKQRLGFGAAANAAVASTTGISSTVAPDPSKSLIATPSYSKGRDELMRDARQIEKNDSKKSISGLAKRIKRIASKYGYKRIASALAARAAIGLGGFVGGPIGIITTLISAGLTLFTISQILDDIEDADNIDSETNQENITTERQVTTLTPVSSLAEPSSGLTSIQTQADYESYKQRVMQLESGGRNVASATGGSAFGLYQITQDTFQRIKKQDPSLKDVSFDQMKSDPSIQSRAFDSLTASNANDLQKAGLEPTPFNLYLAHRLGSGAAIRILKAEDSNSPLIQTAYAGKDFRFQSQVYNLNPDMRDKTTGQFLAERAAAFGGGGSSFKASAATAVDTQEDKLGELLGLNAFVKAIDVMKPVIIDASSNAPAQSSQRNSQPNPGGATIPAHQTSKDELRYMFGIQPGSMMAP